MKYLFIRRYQSICLGLKKAFTACSLWSRRNPWSRLHGLQEKQNRNRTSIPAPGPQHPLYPLSSTCYNGRARRIYPRLTSHTISLALLPGSWPLIEKQSKPGVWELCLKNDIPYPSLFQHGQEAVVQKYCARRYSWHFPSLAPSVTRCFCSQWIRVQKSPDRAGGLQSPGFPGGLPVSPGFSWAGKYVRIAFVLCCSIPVSQPHRNKRGAATFLVSQINKIFLELKKRSNWVPVATPVHFHLWACVYVWSLYIQKAATAFLLIFRPFCIHLF